jgi:hypothetical protein
MVAGDTNTCDSAGEYVRGHEHPEVSKQHSSMACRREESPVVAIAETNCRW